MSTWTEGDDAVYCSFRNKRSPVPYTLRKVRTTRGCLEGLALMGMQKWDS
jgi:hypothetical protein